MECAWRKKCSVKRTSNHSEQGLFREEVLCFTRKFVPMAQICNQWEDVDISMENSYRFFENKDCKYFPCHKGLADFNCLFCYCPMYRLEHCPGNPRYFEKNGRRIKDCSGCTFPHDPEHYDTIMQILREA